MYIDKPHLVTHVPIWYPKYVTESGGYEVWISAGKVRYSSSTIIVDFVKAKHLQGQRFAVRRQDVQRSPIGTNGKIRVYKVPFDKLEPYETKTDLFNKANELFK